MQTPFIPVFAAAFLRDRHAPQFFDVSLEIAFISALTFSSKALLEFNDAKIGTVVAAFMDNYIRKNQIARQSFWIDSMSIVFSINVQALVYFAPAGFDKLHEIVRETVHQASFAHTNVTQQQFPIFRIHPA